MFILSVAALILSLIALSIALSARRYALQRIIEEVPVIPVEEQRATQPKEKKGVVIEPVIELNISSTSYSIESIAANLGVSSILFFNLAGLPITHYNVKDPEHMAASLAEFIHTLRRLGFPTEVISLSNGIRTYIIGVHELGDIKIYALVIGKTDMKATVKELRASLKDLIVNMIKRGEYS